MNIGKLNFEKLYKLQSPDNRLRIARAVERTIKRRWQQAGIEETFCPSSAKYHECTRPIIEAYFKLLNLLRSEDTRLNLKSLADAIPSEDIPRSVEALEYHRVSVHTYASQGFGKEKYAETSALITAAGIEAAGIPSYVKRDGDEFVVFANTNELGRQILWHRPGLSLREAVRKCWSLGCQPRVFNPWLPADFERQNGLDYFGNEVTPTGGLKLASLDEV